MKRKKSRDGHCSMKGRDKDGNGINHCSVYPANNPYIYVGKL